MEFITYSPFDFDVTMTTNENNWQTEEDFHRMTLGDEYLNVFNTDNVSSNHREAPIFDPNNDNTDVSESSINAILNIPSDVPALIFDQGEVDGILAYLQKQPTVAPLTPTPDSQTTFFRQTNRPEPNQSPSKLWMIYDKTLARERRPLLYEFLRLLLDDSNYRHIATYVDRENGVFKLIKPKEVARLWKDVKGRNSDTSKTNRFQIFHICFILLRHDLR